MTAGPQEASSLAHACEPGDVAGTPSSAAAPDRARSRLIGIDAARGVALVGMMAVHVLDPVGPDGTPSLAWSLAGGKSAALFALLAGVGIAFSSGRRHRPHGRAWVANAGSLAVRALLIAMVGLVLGYLVPRSLAAVILPYYALLFLLAIPLLSLSIRALLAVAAVIVVGMPVLSHLLRAGTETAVAGNPTFEDLLGDPGRLLTELTLTGTYPALSWLAYLCVGMAVGQARLSTRRVATTMAVAGLGLAVGARAVSWFLLDVLGGRSELEAVALQSLSSEEYTDLLDWGPSGITPADTPWWLATVSPHSSTPLDLVFTIGVALAVLGACILIGRTGTSWLRPLAAAGSMTLTLYCLHLLMLSSPFMPDHDGASFLLQVAVVVAFGLGWSRYHARGPLEDVVASATSATRRRLLSGRGAKGTIGAAPGD
ncbi:heparan-alpha-glucosaminide N-acetyltransferase domain-containing protein [Blastococcus sp. TF02-9]|uniref:heparan-alpha-glucosaminide N-acetyltransferase domain-containing protein n=1 Tax=Blastococcus sp. TF02-09 TaxID=2250576 RepID=UPI0011BFD096|nr:heparan-alpha-glucosaminide N-acetyltransferase domain-containing protein [Blastococcus sp. TF02-9]